MSCWAGFSRIMIVGLGFRLVLARSGDGGGDPEDRDSEGECVDAGSGMMSLESTHVGGLFSSKERLMHQDPGRIPRSRLFSSAIENVSCHIRAIQSGLLSKKIVVDEVRTHIAQ